MTADINVESSDGFEEGQIEIPCRSCQCRTSLTAERSEGMETGAETCKIFVLRGTDDNILLNRSKLKIKVRYKEQNKLDAARI